MAASGETQREYLNSINHFRAIAILFIVAGHCFAPANVHFDTFWEKAFFLFTTGGSVYFVFISGVLFHHIYYRNFSYVNFLRKKAQNILLPYLILGFAPIISYVFFRDLSAVDYFPPLGDGYWNKYAVPAFKYLLTGRFLTGYWYIPFIMILFFLSPLHIAFMKLGARTGLWVTLALLGVSMLIHRPILNASPLQAVFYFTPVYLLGILSSIHKQKIYSLGRNGELLFLMCGIFFILLQIYTGKISRYHKDSFVWGGIDLMLLQKTSFCFFFLVFLKRFEEVKNKYIGLIAETSFAIFFLHPLLIKLPNNNWYWPPPHTSESWPLYAFYVLFFIVLSALLAKAAKRLIPKYSRCITGY